MKSITSSSIDLRLAAYAAAGVALAAPAMSSTAKADIVYTPLTLPITIPNNIDGIYLNLVTGASAAASFTGYDINLYAATAGFSELTPTGGGVVGVAGSGPTALPLGTTIGSASTFLTSINAAPAFRTTGLEYLGLRFTNEATGGIDYGWLQIQTTGATGFPATILAYAYNNTTGASIAAGQITNVPEPTTTAALGLGALALGAVGVRRMRQSKQAVA